MKQQRREQKPAGAYELCFTANDICHRSKHKQFDWKKHSKISSESKSTDSAVNCLRIPLKCKCALGAQSDTEFKTLHLNNYPNSKNYSSIMFSIWVSNQLKL